MDATNRRSPTAPSLETANDRLKQSFADRMWLGMMAATVLHFLVFQLWPEMSAADYSRDVAELMAIDIPPEVEIPPAPERIQKAALPVISADVVDVDATIAPNTFDDFEPAPLVAPPAAAAGVVSDDTPSFVNMTVRPSILNMAEVQRAMVREYPQVLRDARIGGTVVVWFLVDEEGRVRDTRIQTSSGQPRLDEAALKVASVYRFSPAMNRDQVIKVWVTIPIKFTVEP